MHYSSGVPLALATVMVLGLGLAAGLLAQAVSGPVSAQPVFQREGEFSVDAISQPRWLGKFLVDVRDRESKSPLFEVTDSNGNKERVSFELPDTAFIQALRYNAGADGSIVAIGIALSGKNGGASFLAWIPPDRKSQTVIQTAPFVPEAVAVAADGSIWSVGTLFDDDKRRTIADNVIQRYATSGKLLFSVAVPGVNFPSETPGDATQNSTLQASKDRVGWFTSANQYLEFSLDGKEIGRYEGPPIPRSSPNHNDRFALSVDNQAVLGIVGSDMRSYSMAMLNRKDRVWVPVTLMDGEVQSVRERLAGFDGTELVTQSDKRAGIITRWKRGAASGAR